MKKQKFQLVKNRFRCLRAQGCLIKPRNQKPEKLLIKSVPNEMTLEIIWV